MPFLRSVSMPRSGHHYVWKLLQAVLRKRLDYHSVVLPPLSAGADPARLVFWKTHDGSFDVPTEVAGTRVIVQWREPVGWMLSEAQRQWERSGKAFKIANPDYRKAWLAHQVRYHRRFHAKWVQPAAGDLRFDYRRLTSEPEAVIADILNLVGMAATEAAIHAAVESLRGVHADRSRADPARDAFTLRTDRVSDLIPAAEIDAYERACLDPAIEFEIAARRPAQHAPPPAGPVRAAG